MIIRKFLGEDVDLMGMTLSEAPQDFRAVDMGGGEFVNQGQYVCDCGNEAFDRWFDIDAISEADARSENDAVVAAMMAGMNSM